MKKSLLREYLTALSGAVLAFFIASVVISGFPAGLWPNFEFPYVYAGDALFQYSMIQRSIEGWVTDSDRLGYPFGSPWFDYPSSDALNILALKIIGTLIGSYYAAANFYFLFGFSLNFIAAFFLLRFMSIKASVAYSVSFLFAFSAYNFAREFYGHTFYTWYFVVPIYTWLSIVAYRNESVKPKFIIAYSIVSFLCASFGVYFAFYGFLTIATAGCVGFARGLNLESLKKSALFCFSILIGTFANLASHLIFVSKHGANDLVAQRLPMETEVYSLKLIHLILPPLDHRIQELSEIGAYYAAHFPLSNTISYLGIFGIFGFILICVGFLFGRAFTVLKGNLFLISALFFLALITTTTGSLNVLFAMFISPTIRGWDRFSIFILLYCLIALSVAMSRMAERIPSRTFVLLLAAMVVIGVLDQTSYPSSYIARSSRSTFEMDREVIRNIEASLPVGSAIYQMPYHPFPEEGAQHQLTVYEQLTPFLNSESLRWSSGGVKGREASVFYSKLNETSVSEQVSVAQSMGFAGIYVHKTGYVDGGMAVEAELESIIGSPPSFGRSDGLTSFFFLDSERGDVDTSHMRVQ